MTYRSAGVIGDCLRSLPAALAGLDPVEVLVVDNASGDDTTAVAWDAAPADLDVRVITRAGNDGYAAAINTGLAEARLRGDVLILNPDVRLDPGSVGRLAEAVHGPAAAGVAVPLLTDEEGRRQDSLRREPTVRRALAEAVLGGPRAARWRDLGETISATQPYREGAEADWATGAVLLVARRVLDDIGVLDESMFLYSEETDLLLRARDAGHTTRLVPGAGAVHLGGELTVSPRLWALRTVNRVKLHRRRHNRLSTAAFAAASLLGEGGRAVAGRGPSRDAARALVTAVPGIVARPPAPPEPAPAGWICFSAQDWWYHNRAHSDFQLMRRVAQRRPVLLVNSIGLRVPRPGRSTQPVKRIARKLNSVARPTTRPLADTPGYHVMTPLSLPTYGTERARRFNAWLVRTQITRAARKVGVIHPGRPDPVQFLTIPTAIDAARQMPASALVVNRSDKQSAFPEADGAVIAALEERAMGHAARVFFTSHALMEEERDLAGAGARFLDHGVDAGHFTRRPPAEVPADLRAIPGPVVGFFGSLDDYLVDFDLLEALARALPEASLVLIGDATCSLDALEARPNVHLLGFRPYETIPAYGSGFDVGLMPWLDNRWIRHANPIKMKEYLALGLPVVSTDFGEVHRYGELIRIGGDPESFIAAVKQTLADGGLGTPATRRAAVEHATWDAAARYLLDETESAGEIR